MIKIIKHQYWTFSLDGDLSDAEYQTSKECLEQLDERYAEIVAENYEDMRNGETLTADAAIVQFQYNDDNEKEIISSENVTAEYEHYHGDLKEHGTY